MNPRFLVAIKQHGSHDIMVLSKSSKVKTLKTIMEENGHKHIDILKVPSGGYPLRGQLGLAWDVAGCLGFYFDVFFVEWFLLATFKKGSRTHGGETGTRTYAESVVKPVNSRVIIGPPEKCMTQDLQICVCDLVGRKGWKAVSQMAVFE